MSLTSPGRKSDRSSPQSRPQKRGVLLVNTGSPDQPDVPSVRRYLSEFLGDPLVIQLPRGLGWFHGILSRLIALFRGSHSAELYRTIWTQRGSPLKFITEDQADELQSSLPEGWRVFTAMRYGQPRIVDVMREIDSAGIEELVVVPMYPQFSQTTTGTVIREVYRALRTAGQQINVTCRTSWYDDVGYVHAQARRIADWVAANDLSPDETYLLFSAHGLPVSYIERGDPYARQIDRTVKLVVERLGWPAERTSLAFQSRFGPAEWLLPDTEAELLRLAGEDCKNVVVCPISFTADCLETLEELGVRYRESFEDAGGRLFLCPAVNTYEPFIAALKNLVLRGSQPLTSWGAEQTPLLDCEHEAAAEDATGEFDLDGLVLVGVAREGRLRTGRGPCIHRADAAELACVKTSHDEVFTVLKRMRERENEAPAEFPARRGAAATTGEALIWNTCHRFEYYGWLANAVDETDRRREVARIRQQFFGDAHEGSQLNILFGVDAWHHLLRTVCGLNSGLPGDADIIEQLGSARRMAERAGVMGKHLTRLADEATKLARELSESTVWGDFSRGYCYAALSRVFSAAGVEPADARYVIVGGSSTSCSVLSALFTKLDARQRNACLVYRNHGGGQIKILRRALGNGKRLRVNSYSEQAVIDAVADADVLILGIDHDEPVLTASDFRALRDFAQRPLTIIDFNTFGSVRDVEAIEGVTLWPAEQLEREVRAYADQLCADERFDRAVDDVEDRIERQLPHGHCGETEQVGVLAGSAA